jgi:hypothetical protein
MVPNISVVIPTHGGRFLSAALASVRAKTLGDWELVVVDDRSTDGAVEMAVGEAAEDPRVRLISHARDRRRAEPGPCRDLAALRIRRLSGPRRRLGAGDRGDSVHGTDRSPCRQRRARHGGRDRSVNVAVVGARVTEFVATFGSSNESLVPNTSVRSPQAAVETQERRRRERPKKCSRRSQSPFRVIERAASEPNYRPRDVERSSAVCLPVRDVEHCFGAAQSAQCSRWRVADRREKLVVEPQPAAVEPDPIVTVVVSVKANAS